MFLEPELKFGPTLEIFLTMYQLTYINDNANLLSDNLNCLCSSVPLNRCHLQSSNLHLNCVTKNIFASFNCLSVHI